MYPQIITDVIMTIEIENGCSWWFFYSQHAIAKPKNHRIDILI